MKSNQTSHILLAGMSNVKTTLKDNSTIFYNVKPILIIQLNSFTSKCLFQRSENVHPHKDLCMMFIEDLFIIKVGKNPVNR